MHRPFFSSANFAFFHYGRFFLCRAEPVHTHGVALQRCKTKAIHFPSNLVQFHEHKSGKQIIWTPSYDSFLPSGGDQAFETGLQKVLS
jgi:hypothetical protein